MLRAPALFALRVPSDRGPLQARHDARWALQDATLVTSQLPLHARVCGLYPAQCCVWSCDVPSNMM